MDYSQTISKVVFTLIKDPDFRWNLKKSFPEAFFLPHMKPEEYQLFKELCRDKKVFLEYGSGGSTIYFLKNNKKVFSVESNPEFYSFMNSINLVKKTTDKNLHFKFVDLGPTNKWGKPTTNSSSTGWPDYYAGIWNEINPIKDKVDIILIDGRFRVCCCLYSILKVMEYNWEDTVLLIHDFWRREQYHIVLEFLDEIKSARNLVSFKIKPDIAVEQVKEKLQKYALVAQ